MLELDLTLMLTVFLFFFTLLFLLNQILFKPMLFFIENRDKNLNSNSQDIEDIAEDIKLINLEASTLLKKTNIEANLLIEEMINKTKKNVSDTVNTQVDKLDKEYQKLMKIFLSDNVALENNLKLNMDSFKENIHNRFNNLSGQ